MSKYNSTLTAERLRELLHYNPNTGLFTRKVCTSNSIKIGDIAGGIQLNGYVGICVCSTLYLAHRLAWLYMTGKWPKKYTDHINGIKNDNRWMNLREASPACNSQNQTHPRSDNKCGYLGVFRCGRRWTAQIQISGKNLRLGTFDTPQEAHAAYLRAKRRLHPACTI